MMLVPMTEALTQAAADVLAIQLTSVRGHLSRRQARRAVDRLADALEAYCVAYQAEFGRWPDSDFYDAYQPAIAHAMKLEEVDRRRTDYQADWRWAKRQASPPEAAPKTKKRGAPRVGWIYHNERRNQDD